MSAVSRHFMRRIRNIHFTGIGGAGMSGIAEVFHNLGYRISGSDIAENAMVRHLRDLGIEIAIGHRSENIADAHVVVVSTAIAADNPEIEAARAHMRGERKTIGSRANNSDVTVRVHLILRCVNAGRPSRSVTSAPIQTGNLGELFRNLCHCDGHTSC